MPIGEGNVTVTFVVTEAELSEIEKAMNKEDNSIRPSRSAFIRRAVLAYVEDILETEKMLESMEAEQ